MLKSSKFLKVLVVVAMLSLCTVSIAIPLYNSDIPADTERVEASVGGHAVFNCHLDFPFGNEIPYHLQWDKEGDWILSWYSGDGESKVSERYQGRVSRVGDVSGLGRGSLNVSAVKDTDAGLYRCSVSFPNRTPPRRNNGTFYFLEVNGSNLIIAPPMNATVLEGETAEFECQPKTPDSKVQWYKDGVEIEDLQDLMARIDLTENSSLVIPKTEISDPGDYSCRVTDKDGQTQAASAYLDVQYKAKVVYAPKELYLQLGAAASLDCHFSANPPLTNLRWEKDGFLFDPYNVPGVFYSRNGSLLFNKVEEAHEGAYSCTAYNALGTAGPGPAVRVVAARPPALAAAPRPLYLARLGSSLTMPCAPVHSDMQRVPTVTWTRKDGTPLPSDRASVTGGNLTITDVRAGDAGAYTCTLRAAASSARTVHTDVHVENVPPRAPQGLAARAGVHDIHLSWETGPLTREWEFFIWYRAAAAGEIGDAGGGGAWRMLKLLSRGAAQGSLTGLRAGARYELRVLAQDPLGDGLFSRPLFITTLDDEADVQETASAAAPVTMGPLAPLDVSIRLVDAGALVQWGEGKEAAGGEVAGSEGGTGTSCSVRAYSGKELQLTHDKFTTDSYALIPEVVEGERYLVQVECGAAAGSASLQVPAYNRLRAVSAGCAVAALLLAALAITMYLARDQLCQPRRIK